MAAPSDAPDVPVTVPVATPAGALARFLDGDVWHSFKRSPAAVGAAAIAFVCVFCALFANWVAPHNPFDLAAGKARQQAEPDADDGRDDDRGEADEERDARAVHQRREDVAPLVVGA
ncbi:MAG: hypothetical protein KGI35_10090, partial [Burkholderiales bacterium]|nr:hypothetical protein [Burkholderiales bacterium]